MASERIFGGAAGRERRARVFGNRRVRAGIHFGGARIRGVSVPRLVRRRGNAVHGRKRKIPFGVERCRRYGAVCALAAHPVHANAGIRGRRFGQRNADGNGMDGRGVYPSRAAAEKLRIRRLVCRGGRERRAVCRRAGQRPRALERRSGRRGVRPLAGHGRYFIRAERGRKLYRRRRYGQGADRNRRARIPQRQARHGDCAGGPAKLCRFALAGGGCVCHVYRAGSAVRLRQFGNIGASVHRRLARCRRRGSGFGLPLRRNGVCKFRRSGAILQQYGLCLLLSPAKSARHCGDRCRCRRVRCVQRRFLFKERCAHRRIAGRKGVLRLRLARGYRAR